MKNRKKGIGQITVKKIGNKFAVCISGTPQELKNSWKMAAKIANELREKHGRKSCKDKKYRDESIC